MRGGVPIAAGLGALADDDMPEGLLHQATVALLEPGRAPGELLCARRSSSRHTAAPN